MRWHYTPYIIPLLITTIIATLLLIYTWRHRAISGALAIVGLTLAAIIWSSGYILEIGSLDLPAKIFWGKVQYLGIVTIPVVWLAVILQFTRRQYWLTRPILIGLTVIPALTLVFVWTTEAHGLVWQKMSLATTGPFLALKLNYGPWFWVNWLYANCLLAVGVFLLLHQLRHSTGPVHRQTGVLLLVALTPWLGNALYVSGLLPVPNLDLTPLFFVVSAIGMAWSLFRFRLLYLMPVAHKAIFESMSDGVIVLDSDNRVVDVNPAAEAILGFKMFEAIGKTDTQVMSNWPDLVKHLRQGADLPYEIKLTKKAQPHYYDVRLSTLYERNSHLSGYLLVLRDITERKHSEEALRKSEEQTRLIFELAPIGMFIVTLSGRLAQVNQAFCQLMDYQAEELTGRSYFELILPEDVKLILKLNDQLRRNVISHYQQEIRYLSQTGQMIHVLAQMALIHDAKGQPLHFIGQVIDISDQKQVEQALIEARDQALETSRLKSELVAKVSHELRTPLTAVLGFAEMLEAEVYGPLTPDQRQPAYEIIDSAQYLIKLVNEILSQAQLEAGQLKLENSVFAPAALLEKISAKMRPLAQAKSLALTTEIAPNLPALLYSDIVRLQQILVNLVGNAIKFTITGTIHIRLFHPALEYWGIQVSDTGVGIPLEAQSYIFEPFRQIDGSPTRQHSGTGLGLAIVKQLTTLMGGEIVLISEVNQGTTFTVLLPIEQPSEGETS